MPYDVASIRKKLREQMSGKYVDPDEFKPAKADSTQEAKKYRFYILPPLKAGDELKSGTVEKDMELFYLQHGNHWVHNKPNPCPRVWGSDDCPICEAGFEILKKEKDEQTRKELVRQWMPNTYYMVNIFFTNSKVNPEDLRNKVKFFNAPKTCLDIWANTLLKDDAGDTEEPEAFGAFFDESAAFVFQLEVLKQGRNNSYKTSHFLANHGKPSPMIKDAEGNADHKKLEKLLKLRHNLFEKVREPEPDKIEKLARVMLDGDDFEDGGGFDDDETDKSSGTKQESAEKTKVKTESSTKQAEAKKQKQKQQEQEQEEEEDVVDTLADEVPFESDKSSGSDKKEEESDKETVSVSSSDDDDGDDDIDMLLDQLADDD